MFSVEMTPPVLVQGWLIVGKLNLIVTKTDSLSCLTFISVVIVQTIIAWMCYSLHLWVADRRKDAFQRSCVPEMCRGVFLVRISIIYRLPKGTVIVISYLCLYLSIQIVMKKSVLYPKSNIINRDEEPIQSSSINGKNATNLKLWRLKRALANLAPLGKKHWKITETH